MRQTLFDVIGERGRRFVVVDVVMQRLEVRPLITVESRTPELVLWLIATGAAPPSSVQSSQTTLVAPPPIVSAERIALAPVPPCWPARLPVFVVKPRNVMLRPPATLMKSWFVSLAAFERISQEPRTVRLAAFPMVMQSHPRVMMALMVTLPEHPEPSLTALRREVRPVMVTLTTVPARWGEVHVQVRS